MQAKFRQNEKAVYPVHGVTVVQGVQTKKVGGSPIDFYVLKVIKSGATIMVPVTAAEKAGMRRLISDKEINEVYGILKVQTKVFQKAWNKRLRMFNEKLRSGSMCEVAEVIRDLWGLKLTKDLSYGEKRMLEKSKALLVTEICASKNSTETEVEETIEAFFDSYQHHIQ